MTGAEFLAGLQPRQGTIIIGGGIATIEVPEQFQYLDPAGAQRLLTEGWGNPPAASEGVLGMLVPTGVDVLSPESWAVIISFDEDGHVDDAEAEEIDYTRLLRQMQDGAAQENESRREAGYPAVTIVGWAAPPRYDRATHKLYWAKELAFSGDTSHTLNYSIRALGRRGVLVLNAVASMSALAQIEQAMPQVLEFTAFNEGHRYADYVAGQDRKAAYGIAALIAGGAAAKAGFFKALWLGLLAFKKVIAIGVIAVAAAARGWWARRKAGATA